MRSTIILLFSFMISFPFNNVSVVPSFYIDYESQGFMWNPQSNNTISRGGWGIMYSYEKDYFSIKGRFINNRFFGLNNIPTDFTFQQGLSWEGHDPEGDKFDFDFSDIVVAYYKDNTKLSFGKTAFNITDGYRSIVISNKAPSFPFVSYNWDINEQLIFTYIHGSLKSLIDDVLMQSYYDQVGIRHLTTTRNFSFHSLKYKLTDRLHFTIAELVVYANRVVEPIYLIPFVPYWSAQHYLGDTDNMQLYLSTSYKINDSSSLYGSLLIDEWSPSDTFSKENNRNWFAYQFGLKSDKFLFDSSLLIEYNYTDHRIYRHRFSVNDVYSHGYPLGFWAGPHADELILLLNKNIHNNNLLLSLSFSKRGDVTDDMLEMQYNSEYYERYSGPKETFNKLTISIEPNLFFLKGTILEEILLGVHYTFIRYDGLIGIENFKGNDKNSFGLTISYDIDKYYFGQNSTLGKH